MHAQKLRPCRFITDTFSVPTLIQAADSATAIAGPYNMTDRGITWPEEGRKYQATRYQLGQAVPPPNWIDRYPEGYTAANPFPDLSEDEHFQVWMRTAGLPTFRKLYYRNDNENMVAGRYSIDVFTSELSRLLAGAWKAVFELAFSLTPQTIPSRSSAEPSRSSSVLSPSSEDAILSWALRTLLLPVSAFSSVCS